MPTQDTLTDEQIFDIVQPHLPGRGHAHIWTTDPSYARDVGIEVGSRWIVSEMLPEQTVAAARAIEAAARAPLLERIAELEARIVEKDAALNLGLEYWRHRQQRYKNRHPVWVEAARAALNSTGAQA